MFKEPRIKKNNRKGGGANSLMYEKADEKKNLQFVNDLPSVTEKRSSKDSNQTLQRKTKYYKHTDQTYDFGTGKINVGDTMEVGIDPLDVPRGQSANLNKSQDKMMTAIRQRWGINGGGLVKGHLWNDNLGGSAMNYNLYPITKAANSDHLGYVENAVKKFVWQGQPVYYKVEVDANPSIKEARANFACEVREWDPYTEEKGKKLLPNTTIKSDLNDVGAYNQAYETLSGNNALRQELPQKPKKVKEPKTKVGELTVQEKTERLNQ